MRETSFLRSKIRQTTAASCKLLANFLFTQSRKPVTGEEGEEGEKEDKVV